MSTDTVNDIFAQRFGGIRRLYGADAVAIIQNLHVCVVGLGGVGSWAVEALARTGVGRLTLIDYDTVALSNVNRQLPAMTNTDGLKKSAVLRERVEQINPDSQCEIIDDFLTTANLRDYLDPARGYGYVIDAIDSIKFKAQMIYHCKRNKIPIIATGGAGGLTDPTLIHVKDLRQTYNDPLAAKVRNRLRSDFGFSKNLKRNFGIECVFSSQQQVYPKADGSVSHQKPGIHGISLDCNMGYGSATFVTAVFGQVAASRVINRTLQKAARRKTTKV